MRLLRTMTALLALTGAGAMGTTGTAGALDAPVGHAAEACSTAWGSGVKSAGEAQADPLSTITTQRGRCFDRMIFDTGGAKGDLRHYVGYVGTFRQDGSGDRIPVSGGAILQIFVSAPSYDSTTGKPSYDAKAGQPLPGVNLTGYRTFKDTRFGASFEGQTQIGLGVRARLPFRVLQSGDNLIVDVAHTW
ncbi:hypothetical protein ACLGI4_27610 [Streptomyces sp. HMX112]|uniref:AMIN-like domain-containing (lipo)protein n=1 Tax=Streptomyces sp. HMX112 TaxID=3390850 RepID=UPI003A813818